MEELIHQIGDTFRPMQIKINPDTTDRLRMVPILCLLEKAARGIPEAQSPVRMATFEGGGFEQNFSPCAGWALRAAKTSLRYTPRFLGP